MVEKSMKMCVVLGTFIALSGNLALADRERAFSQKVFATSANGRYGIEVTREGRGEWQGRR